MSPPGRDGPRSPGSAARRGRRLKGRSAQPPAGLATPDADGILLGLSKEMGRTWWGAQSRRRGAGLEGRCRSPSGGSGEFDLMPGHGQFPGIPGGSEVKVPARNAGDLGSIPGSGRFPGEGNGNPLPYSCLENPMDRGAGQATVHRVVRSRL